MAKWEYKYVHSDGVWPNYSERTGLWLGPGT
jgi:hypothetical protein